MVETQNKMEFIIATFKEMKETTRRNDWVLFELEFEDKTGTQRFTAFDSVGKKGKGITLNDLKSGNLYNVGFVEDDKCKSIKWLNNFVPKMFKSSSKQKTQKVFNGKSGDIVNVAFDKNVNKYVDFNLDYIDGMKEENREINVNHYIGAFIRTHKQELNLVDLTTFLQDMFNTEIKEKELKKEVEEINL